MPLLLLTPSSIPTAAATYCCILLLSTTTTLSYGKYNYYCCHLQLPFAPLLLLPSSLQPMPPLPPLVLPAAFHSCSIVLLNRPRQLIHMLLRYCAIHRRSQKASRPGGASEMWCLGPHDRHVCLRCTGHILHQLHPHRTTGKAKEKRFESDSSVLTFSPWILLESICFLYLLFSLWLCAVPIQGLSCLPVLSPTCMKVSKHKLLCPKACQHTVCFCFASICPLMISFK